MAGSGIFIRTRVPRGSALHARIQPVDGQNNNWAANLVLRDPGGALQQRSDSQLRAGTPVIPLNVTGRYRGELDVNFAGPPSQALAQLWILRPDAVPLSTAYEKELDGPPLARITLLIDVV